MGTVISTYLDIKGLNNTRDLGGMITKDGRKIKPGKLIRSSRLSKLKDTDWLAENVSLVVDFRSTKEVGEEPDLLAPGVEYLHLPIFEVQGEGVSRDKESRKRIMDSAGPEEAKERMASVYLRFVSNEFCLSQYKKFMHMLLEPREKAVLWHCTAGKDRTGTAALFIQELLGVGREDIMADYLKTNEYLSEEIHEIVKMRAEKLGRPMSETEEDTMYTFLCAYEEYPLKLYAKAEELYGSFDAFIREGLGISDEDQEILRQMYLEQ